MKKSLLFILSILTIGSLFAQPCVPDPNFVSLGVGVYPLPYNVALIDSGYVGVEDTAIVGQDYAFAFTAVVPSTLLNGTVDLFSVTIESVENLPEGLNYECDLPDCIFTPAVPGDPTSGLGCVSISGVTTAAPGSYSIIVNTIASTNLGDISVAFPADPNDNFFNLPEGDYAIHVAEGDTTGSGGTSVMNYSERISTMKNFPNPFASETAIMESQVRKFIQKK